MKKLLVTAILATTLSASVMAQGTIAADNLNGAGNNHATSLGLFFAANGTAYDATSVNVQILGGSSLAPIITLTGANALMSFGGGVYVDPTSGTYQIPGVAAGTAGTLQVLAWIGTAASYADALPGNTFLAWSGNAFVDARTFTFQNPTGGGSPPLPLKSLDGMPAMQLGIIPEPGTFALLGLGALGLMIFRRK